MATFDSFVAAFGKRYSSPAEAAQRYANVKATLARMVAYTLGPAAPGRKLLLASLRHSSWASLNKFSDYTPKEFQTSVLMPSGAFEPAAPSPPPPAKQPKSPSPKPRSPRPKAPAPKRRPKFTLKPTPKPSDVDPNGLAITPAERVTQNGGRRLQQAALPEVVDWVAAGKLAGVTDQGNCGACWAITATTVLEAQVGLRRRGTRAGSQDRAGSRGSAARAEDLQPRRL